MITTKLVPTKANAAATLQPAVQSLAIKQVVSDLTSTNRGNDAITVLSEGQVIGELPIPKKIRIKIKYTGSDENGVDVAFLNNADFLALPANTTVTYSDGFGGKLLTRLMNNLNGSTGLLTYGFNVTGYDSDGAKSDSVINGAAMEARYYTGKGTSYKPNDIDFGGEERNTQVQTGLLTVKVMIQLNMVCQLKAHLGAGESLEFVFSTVPMND